MYVWGARVRHRGEAQVIGRLGEQAKERFTTAAAMADGGCVWLARGEGKGLKLVQPSEGRRFEDLRRLQGSQHGRMAVALGLLLICFLLILKTPHT
jgi:hypothetical protein